MRWSSKRTSRSGPALIFGAAGLLAFAFAVAGSSDTKRISTYSPGANYSLPVTEHNGSDYVGLLEILEPLGSATAKADGRVWRLRYNNLDSEFTDGKTRARVQGRDLDLPASFVLENGGGLVPLSSLPTLMQRFLGVPVNFHESSRRLFIGNVGVHFTAQVSKSNPPALVMTFTSPVNPMIATEPGKLRMVFTHEPLVPPGSQTLTFDSSAIPSATFQESNGMAEIAVSGAIPLFARFSNDGRTITITPAPQPAAAQVPAPQPALTSASPPSQAPSATAPPPQVANNSVQYFAVVDASHGGDERGAALSDQLAEKDITLAFARRLEQELQAHGLATLVLRDGDTTLSLDQRASLTNVAHPAIYISLHAASQGTGVRLYTALLPAGSENQGGFLDWNTAQLESRSVSQTAQSSLAAEFAKRQVPVRSLLAPLRPLNNITAAAVAIEIVSPAGKVADLNSPAYQQLVAESVTAGVEAVRDKLGVAR
jgi:N-acetylmuramoyl-L-alanine amidase